MHTTEPAGDREPDPIDERDHGLPGESRDEGGPGVPQPARQNPHTPERKARPLGTSPDGQQGSTRD